MMQREEMIMIIISLTALSPLDSLAQGAVFFGCLYSPKILRSRPWSDNDLFSMNPILKNIPLLIFILTFLFPLSKANRPLNSNFNLVSG